MKKVKKAKKGFTLIEMIVVVAIIAVLAGIAIPQVSKQIANSKKKADIATARSIAGVIQQYIAEGKVTNAATTGWIQVTTGDTTFKFGEEIQNADEVLAKAKFNPEYKFYYKYDTTSVMVGAGKDSSNIANLYPTQSEEYIK